MAEKKKKKKTDGNTEIKKKRLTQQDPGPEEQQDDVAGEPAVDKEDSGMESCECSGKTKERSAREYRDLLNRLSRIEGQVRGIRGMLERDAYCTDILIQVAAVNAALNSFNKVLLSNHIRTCVTDHIKAGDDSVIDELVTLLQKLMK